LTGKVGFLSEQGILHCGFHDQFDRSLKYSREFITQIEIVREPWAEIEPGAECDNEINVTSIRIEGGGVRRRAE
jgi:hypothetical protein